MIIISMAGLKRYNQEPLYNEILGTTIRKIFFTTIIVKYMKKNLDITKPRYSEQILLIPWPFVISMFHCILQLQGVKKIVCYTARISLYRGSLYRGSTVFYCYWR